MSENYDDNFEFNPVPDSDETMKGEPIGSALPIHSSENLICFLDDDVKPVDPVDKHTGLKGQIKTCTAATECGDLLTWDLNINFSFGRLKKNVHNPECLEKRRANREMAKLPMLACKDEFVSRLKSEKVLVVTAETGSGKTTQLPQYCAEEFPGLVICTQPRVIAAISVAQRIAKEFDDAPVGRNVGYETRSGNKVRGRQIMITTDAALIRMAQRDRLLEDVGVLIIDEAHERSLNTDIVVGIAKTVLQQRPNDFRVVIASATIDPKPFLDFFFEVSGVSATSKPLTVPGRVFPVTNETRNFNKDADDFSSALADEVVKTLRTRPDGHCLVFLQGAREVDRAIARFEKLAQSNWKAFPLYGTLSPEDQNKVLTFDDNGGTLRMIVFCTNVAETSLTVPNVRLVIDSGLAKEARYDAERRMTVLEEVYISQSSAEQRKGRAGRTVEGHCVRLFTWETLTRKNIEPEILRSSLDLVMLQVCSLGFNPLEFSFITRPKERLMRSSLDMLTEMGCLLSTFTLTERGRLFNSLPLDPRLSNFVLLAHEEFGEGSVAAEIAAILSAPGSILFFNSKDKSHKQETRDFNGFSSDLLFLQSIYKKWLEVGNVDSTNCCKSCHKNLPGHIVAKEGGCRSCRVKFSKEDCLNNKILNIVRGTVAQVKTIIDNRIVGSSTDLSSSFLIENTEQAIGICLARSFPEQMCEFIMPSNPTNGTYSILSKLKGQLSFSSILRVSQPGSKYLIPMSLTRIPSGLLLMNQAHHIALEWLPPASKQRIEEQSLNTTECYKMENVGGRYCVPCRKYFQQLFDEGEQFAGFVVCQYDVTTNTLSAFSPQENTAEVAAICDFVVKSSIEEDLTQEVTIGAFNGSATLTVTAGFNIKEIKAEQQQSCRVHFTNPPAKTRKELLQWACRIAVCKEADIEWCTLQTSWDVEGRNGSVAVGIVVFHKEVFAKKAQTNYSFTDSSFEHANYRVLVKSSHLNVEALLRSYNVHPTKMIPLREGGFQIHIVSLPQRLDEDRLRALFRRYELPNPSFIKTTRPVNGTQKAFVTFKVIDDKSKDNIVSTCRRILEFNSSFEIAVPDKRATNLTGVPYTRNIRVTTKWSEKVEPSEHVACFQTCLQADTLCKMTNLRSQFEVDGTATVVVRHPDVFCLDEHLDKIASIYDVNYSKGKHDKVTRGQEQKSTKKGQEIRFNGNITSVCGQAVESLKKIIAPIKFSFETSDKRLMGEELRANGKLQLWAEVLGVDIEEHLVCGNFSGINIHGEKYHQGQFMAKLAEYYDRFKSRYHLMALSPAANCLFRKGNPGETQLKKLVEEKKFTEAQIRYRSFLSAIEISIKPNTRRFPFVIIKECESAINDMLSKFNEKSSAAKKCVYCNVHPGKKFSICGHPYCKECLQQVVELGLSAVSISKYVTDAEAGKLEEKLKKDLGCCPACNTEIFIKDLQQSLSRVTMDEACMAFAQLLLRRVDHHMGVCPMTLCGAFIPKQAGYSSCPMCKQFVCPTCGVINDCLHLGVACERYQRLLKCGLGVDYLRNDLIKNAMDYVYSHWESNVIKQTIQKIDVNPGLENGCMALQRYCAAIERVGIEEFKNRTVYAWHGTSEAAIPAICNDGFDPKTRSRQLHGPGEYFGIDANTSLGFDKGCDRLIVAQLIQGVAVKKIENFGYVVNNPADWSYAFNLPVLVVTCGSANKAPISWILEEQRLLPYPFEGPPSREGSPQFDDIHLYTRRTLPEDEARRTRSPRASATAYRYNYSSLTQVTNQPAKTSMNISANVYRVNTFISTVPANTLTCGQLTSNPTSAVQGTSSGTARSASNSNFQDYGIHRANLHRGSSVRTTSPAPVAPAVTRRTQQVRQSVNDRTSAFQGTSSGTARSASNSNFQDYGHNRANLHRGSSVRTTPLRAASRQKAQEKDNSCIII